MIKNFSVFELFTHAIIMDFNANFCPVIFKMGSASHLFRC